MATISRTALVLTGERKDRRFLVTVYGKPIWLPATLFSTLCELVLDRQQSASGFVPISCKTIYRLRKAINDAAREGSFDDLIEAGADQEYRLRIGFDDVAVGKAFAELRGKHLLSDAEMDILSQSCHEMCRAEVDVA
jgi:hypothetical protein